MLKGQFQLARIDLKRYKKEWNRELKESNSNAALEWLLAAMSKVPVWSGASISTFKPLANEVGVPVFSGAKPGIRSRENLGVSRSDGSLTESSSELKYGFSYETSLRHLVHNNFFNANSIPDPTLFSKLLNPGPYRFDIIARKAAMNQYKQIKMPNIPIKIKRVRST